MIIDLGCGRKKRENALGIDCQDFPCVDLVCDCNNIIPLPDNVATEIHANDFLEHIENNRRIHIMDEIWRLLEPNGVLYSSTPSTDGRGAFQDPTHMSFWNENSFWYYTDDRYRDLYNIKAKFQVIDVHTTDKVWKEICWVKAILKAKK